MYHNAYAELDRVGAADLDAVRRALVNRTLDQSVLFAEFASAHPTHGTVIENIGGMCIVSESSHWPLDSAALKKTTVLAEVQFILTSQIDEDAGGDRGYLPSEYSPEHQNLDVWSALVRFRPLVERGLTFILPKQCVLSERGTLASGTHRRSLPRKGAFLAFDLPSSVSYFSDPKTDSTRSAVLRIEPRLPHVEGLSLDAILALRADEPGSFQRFQMRLIDRLSTLDGLANEQELLRALLEIDSEVRLIEESFQLLRQKRYFSSARAIAGIAGLGVCAVVDTELAKALSSLLGTFGVRDLLHGIEAEIIEKKRLKKEPYYFPWLIHSRSSGARTIA